MIGRDHPLGYAVSDRRGDLSGIHPIELPRPEAARFAESVPQASKEHAYLFFVNGFDPFYYGNFRGQCDYLRSLGFSNASCYHMNQGDACRERIRQVHRDDPQARIALIGFSFGANMTRTMANELAAEEIPVDLLVYLGGDTIQNTPESWPANVKKVVNINGHPPLLLGYDMFFRGPDLDGASNHRLDVWHFQLPSRSVVTETLLTNVTELVLPAGKAAEVRQNFSAGR